MQKSRLAWAQAMPALLLVSAGLVGVPCFAQTVSVAQISGFVSDPTGAAVAGAQVIATETETQAIRQTTSDATGSYVLPALPVGPYRLEIKAAGFKSYVRSGLVLQVGSDVKINATLEVGAVSESVEVSAQANMVQTTDSSVSQVVEQQRIVDLPLNGRDPAQLILLSGASIQAAPTGADLTGSKNFHSSMSISVAGSQANGVNYMLDGADNNDSFSNVDLPMPFPDALQEFSVQTGSLPGQYGRSPGATVNAVTKSGTNQFHGDMFEFLRNGDVNARNFFGSTHDSLKRNQFGGTVGGPIMKDRLFFFGGFQRTFERSEPPQHISNVPTPAVINNGDFSVIDGPTCIAGGKGKSVIDPLTGKAFPKNQIPVSRYDPASLALLKYLPASSDPCGKVTYGIPANDDEEQYVGRVDWMQSSKHTVFGRYLADNYTFPASFFPGNALVTTQAGNLELAQSATIGDTYTFSPTMLNTFHATFTRRRDDRGAASTGINPNTIGVNVPIELQAFLQTSVSGYFSTGCGTCANAFFNVNTYQLADDVNWTRGKHQIAYGVDVIRDQFNSVNDWMSNGSFSFNGQYASGKNMNDALAAFMLGVMSDFQQSANLVNATRGTILGLYIQDTYRVTPRLTINAGLRWEPWIVPYDKYNHGNVFSQAAFNAGQRSSVFTNAPAGLEFYGDQGIPRGFENNKWNNFSPRVGIAWDPNGDGKQSIRISGGILRDTEELFYNERLTTNAPYGSQVDIPFPFGAGGTFANPWNAYAGGSPFPLPSPLPKNYVFPTAGAYVNLPLNLQPTYTTQWSASYQRQIGANWMASVTYLGNKTSHIWAGEDQNAAVYIAGSSASTNVRRPLYLQNPALGAAYSSIVYSDQGGNANYNAMLLQVQHRFSNGFTFNTNYTYSHCLDQTDFTGELANSAYEDPYNRALDYGNCGFDLRHNWTTSLVAISPVKGNNVAWRILGNWQFSPIITVQSGTPVQNITTNKDLAETGINKDRPNVASSGVYADSSIPPSFLGVSWLNPAAFSYQPLGTYGNLGRNALYNPGQFDVDASLSRLFRITERWKLEARAEAFNLTNHANFKAPTTALNNSKFGVITSASDPRIFQFAMKLYF